MDSLEHRIVNALHAGTERERFVITASEIAKLVGIPASQVVLKFHFKESGPVTVLNSLYIAPNTDDQRAPTITDHAHSTQVLSNIRHQEGFLDLSVHTPVPIEGAALQEVTQAFTSPTFVDSTRAAFISYRKDFYDSETGFPNRRGCRHFISQIPYMIQDETHRTRKQNFMVYVDLNNLKPVNDQAGHHMGDNFLRVVGISLAEATTMVNGPAYTGRIGGDEYLFIARTTRAELDKALDYARGVVTAQRIYPAINRLLPAIPVSFAVGIQEFALTDKFQDIEKEAEKKMFINKDEMKQEGNRSYRRSQTRLRLDLPEA